MKLSQRQIEIFHSIMVNKSMTAAAADLGTSQPTVSRELRELEKRIGFSLFLRFGRRLTPTDQAMLLHEVVCRSFLGLAEISRAASAIRTLNATMFRIASIPAYAESVIPDAIQLFLKTRPTVHFTVHSHEEPSLQHEMTTQSFDLGLTESPCAQEGILTETIPVGDMVCVLPAGHILTKKRTLAPSDFAEIPFIHFEQHDPYRRKLDEAFLAAGITRSYVAETTTAASVCAMVSRGLGVSIINPLTAASHAGTSVVFRPLSVSIPYTLLAWRPIRSARAGQAKNFISALRQVATARLAIDRQYANSS